MSEEEIINRIEVCKKCEMSYREADNVKRADKFNEEIHKWEKLLSRLDKNRDKELSDYKKGYYNSQQRTNKAIEFIDNHNKLEQELGGTIKFNINKLLSILKGEDK